VYFVKKIVTGVNRMRIHIASALFIVFLLPAVSAAQAPPTTVPDRKPTLRRDRTLKTVFPKIIQFEDERIVHNDLTDMLNYSHGGARRRAILALGRIGYPSGVAPLLDVLNNDRIPEMRALAAFSLGEIESHYAASDLLARLQVDKERSDQVRARVAEALGKIASNKLSADALGRFGIKSITDALVALLPPADKPLSNDQKLLTSLTINALLRIKQPSTVQAIAAQLRSPEADIRWQAANALARIRDGIQTAVPALLPLLDDKEPLVKANAARALGVAKDASAVEPLVRLLADTDERVAANAINALGAIASQRAVEPLTALGAKQLEGYRAFDREKQGVPSQQNMLLLIATALGNIKDTRGVAFLKSLRLVDGQPGRFAEVEVAIAKFGETVFFDLPEPVTLPPDWKAVSAYAQGLGELSTARARSILADLLAGKSYGKPDPRAVSDILSAMAAAKAENLREVLLEQLKADDVMVRTTAATLIGDLNDSSDPIIRALEDAYRAARADKMNDARIAIIEAADKLKRPMNIQMLAEETRDEDYVVRLKAAELLRLSTTPVPLPSTKLAIGKVETKHDRAYYKRVTQLASQIKNPIAILRTKKGDIRIELLASDAPMTADNFIQLARSGFFDGLTFMRVVPNFVIQGGDPRNDMNGGPGYQIRDEINLRPYGTGAVGMALSGKDTGGSQFFITHSPQPHLDGGYTVFGQVIEGMDTVNRIARGDRIERVEIIEPSNPSK
jgi:cyclophilin family peptidyl-prolyl cis-trans isomerase/HEAT repeat protein